MIKTGILGYGNIGSGVAEVLRRNRDVLAKKTGEEIQVKYVLDLREFPGDPMEDRLVHDADVILEDPEISIVVETMGGTRPAYDFVKRALLSGKHVVTSNKELVAAHGTELLEIARKNHINFLFEASVGGGIPIIRPLNGCIVADHIQRISGILNGTTNYMLTRMAKDGLDFAEALKEAQDLGFAEKNPEADIEGKDACRKIAILCSLAFGAPIRAEDIPTEGITHVSAADMRYAEKLGLVIKLVAFGERHGDGVVTGVSPVMLSLASPLASIHSVMNAVLVEGDISGALLFSGAGAGKLPTASAVVADVVEAALHPQETMMPGWQDGSISMLSAKEQQRCFFLRMEGSFEERSSELSGIFSIRQEIHDVEEGAFGVVTAPVPEGVFFQKLKTLEGVKGFLRIRE